MEKRIFFHDTDAGGIVYYGNFLKNSRDAKRQSDLKFIQSALEEYHADALHYPPSGDVIPGGQLSYGPSGSAKIYLNQIPVDPLRIPPYLYRPSGTGCDSVSQNCTNYCLYAKMEGTNPSHGDSACNPPPEGYNYGVTRP